MLEPEEQIFGAFAGWDQCGYCLSPMKPSPNRYRTLCVSCQKRKITCVICETQRMGKYYSWTTDHDGNIHPVCIKCRQSTGIECDSSPVKDGHKSRWEWLKDGIFEIKGLKFSKHHQVSDFAGWRY